ncbi:MAG: response regulator [Rhodospirillales bacterium]|nr:response regulator [Rhodospirillales bacterium]
MKILVVDDDEMVRQTIEDILCAEGYEVLAASNGVKAIEILQAEEIGVMVTDIIMPFKEGVETIIECRQQWKDLKIIAISGGGRAAIGDFLETAQKFGADDVIKKPFDPLELIEKVGNLCRKAA